MHHALSADRLLDSRMCTAQRPPGRRAQVEALFDAAVDLDPPARRSLLDARCAGQPSLRHEVSRLLAYAQPTTLDPAQTAAPGRGWSPSRIVRAVEASPFAPPDWMRPGTSIGHYELIRRLGVGGMSTVFLARDTQLGRRVAMKFLHRADHGFENEARVTARCEHPHIVRIYGLGAWRGWPFMVLEYMPGRTLRDVLAERAGSEGGLPVRQVCEIMRPVARALEAAHGQGVVHCDLKPENIMLGDDGVAKVLDFGIARLVECTARSGAVVGTPAYMSPEQLRGEPLDHRTDLWSMGVMLFEMLTGRMPFGDLDAQLDALLDPEQPPHLPATAGLGRLEALVRACLEPSTDRRLDSAAALVAALSDPRPHRRRPIDEAHVFAGLAPFQADDAGAFFGRDAEIESVVGRLRRSPRLVVIGPSGVGKSSLVRAGVGPALAAEGWQRLVMRPGARPLDALAELLTEVDPPPASMPSPAMLAAEWGRFGHVLRQTARARGTRILVVVDQLEEVFADEVDPAARRAFFGCLDGASDEPSAPLRVVATLRDDFLHRLLAETRTPGIARQVFPLGPLTRDGLRAALVGPVEAVGYRFDEPALIDEIIDGLGDSNALPLLQFVAERMWAARDRRGRRVTRDAYAALGGLEGALAAHADRVVDGLPRRDYARVRRLFGLLVTPGRTRQRHRLDDPSALGGDRRLDRVVATLVEGRLLDVHVDADGGRWVELVHASLITRWPRLQEWLSEADGDSVFEARVRAAAAQWRRAERSSGLVWRDRDARAAVRWSRRHRGAAIRARLGDDGAAYLDAVVRGARARRRRAQLVVGLAIAGLLATTLVLARLHAHADEVARQAANWARISVARTLEDDPTTMLAVLREVEGPPPPTWTRLVRQALDRNPALGVLPHPEAVTSAVWAPGGGSIATASGDGVIRLWRPDGASPERTLPAHVIARLRFDPAGRRLVSAGKDGTARIWALGGDASPTVLTHPATVYHAVFDADGQRLATAAFDGKARVWDPDGTERAALDHGVMPDGGPTRVYGVAFTAHEGLATVAWDGRLRLWSLASGEPVTTVDAHGGRPVTSLDRAPDGRLVTGGVDAHVRIWTPDLRPLLAVALDATVNAVRFDSHRGRVVAGCADGSVWAIDVGSGARTRVGQHTGQVHGVDVAPDGTVVSASFDGSARWWSVPEAPRRQTIARHPDAVIEVAVSPDGQTLVTVGEDRTLRVGPLDGASPPRTLYTGAGRLTALALDGAGSVAVADAERGIVRARLDGAPPTLTPLPETWISGLAFLADGALAATDLTGRLSRWAPDDPHRPRLVGRHPDRALAIAADPAGRFIATGAADQSVRLWPLEAGVEPLRLAGHPSKVTAVALDPSGARLAAGTLQGTWLWSLDARPPTRRVLAPDGEVVALAFHPRGESIAAVASDRTLRIWPVEGGEPVVVHDDRPLTAVTFTPDGEAVVVGARDGSVRVIRDLTPPDPARLWGMTYCLSVEKRQALLGLSAAEAERDRARCLESVAAARTAR